MIWDVNALTKKQCPEIRSIIVTKKIQFNIRINPERSGNIHNFINIVRSIRIKLKCLSETLYERFLKWLRSFREMC